MNTKIYDYSKGYTATIVRLPHSQPLAGLDNLRGVSIYGNQVLIGKAEEQGTLGVFFPVETALSFDFLSRNNLYRHNENNADKSLKGLFDDNGRVRAQKLRGHVSQGFWIPLKSLESFCDVTKLKEGDEFNELDGQEICRKYIPKHIKTQCTRSNVKEFKLVDRVDVRCFREHEDTAHLFRNLNQLNLDDIVSVTTKLHGTSLRVGYTPVYRELSWLERLAKWFGVRVQEVEYRYATASRRVIKSLDYEALDGKKHFYADDLWTQAGKVFEGNLHKGEVVYCEVVGWQGESPIQKGYTYGIPKGCYEVYVYRITQTNPDGVVQDLTWPLLKARCAQLGVKYVPEVFYGRVADFVFNDRSDTGQDWRVTLEEKVKTDFLDKPSAFNCDDWNAVEEGIVIQAERLGINGYYKAKSVAFLQHETSLLDKGEIDAETEEALAA